MNFGWSFAKRLVLKNAIWSVRITSRTASAANCFSFVNCAAPLLPQTVKRNLADFGLDFGTLWSENRSWKQTLWSFLAI